MDLNNTAEMSTSSSIKSKREQLRNTIRRQELELQFQQKRKLLEQKAEEIEQKYHSLKFEVLITQNYLKELVFEFNKGMQEAYEALLLESYSDAVGCLEQLLCSLNEQEVNDLKGSKEIDGETLSEMIKEVEKVAQERSDDIYLLFLQSQIDEICNILGEDEDVIQPNQQQIKKCLEIMQQQQVKHSIKFLKKFYKNTQLWFQAVLRQRFTSLDNEILDLIINNLPQEDCWHILMNIQELPMKDKLIEQAWAYKHTEQGIAFIKKTLSFESYLKRFMQMKLFSGLCMAYQQNENRQSVGAQILDTVLSVCCLKMEYFDKLITSGLIQIISSSKITDFTFDGFYNLYRITYWLQQNNSDLFKKSVREELWFQNLLKLLVQQTLNTSVQQTACDLLKRKLQEQHCDKFKQVFNSEIIPDTIHSQIKDFL